MKIDMGSHLTDDLLIESSIDAIIATGTDEIISAWNSAATILFDRQRDEAIGKSLYKVLPSLKIDADLQAAIRSAKDGKKSFLGASNDFNHRKHAEIHVIPLRREDAIIGIMFLIHDVSHRIAKEVELQKLNKELQSRLRQLHTTTNELSKLTHIASHNIRQPVREIYTAVEWLLGREAGAMSNSGRATFRRIQSSLNRMNLLLDDITTLTQINITERPAAFINMEGVIEELKKQFSKKLQDGKTKFTIGNLCDIQAHRDQVLLLLQQIFSYIIKFNSSAFPHIHISCDKTMHTAKNDESTTGEYYLLSIENNSDAFDKADQYITNLSVDSTNIQNYAGPAIALVIAGRIMEVHSGFLEIEKKPQGETSVNCFFPVNDPGLPKKATAGN